MTSARPCSRREALLWLGAAGAASCLGPAPRSDARDELLRRHDAAVRDLLARQLVDPAHPWCGCVPDALGLHTAQSAAGLIETLTAACAHPQSAFAGSRQLLERIDLAAGCLERAQSAHGFVDLLSTNFDSPPDTAFVVHGTAAAAAIARAHGLPSVAERVAPFLRRAGAGLVTGGIHTPNHRWVVAAALAQIHALWPEAAYVRRIDQWLAEGVDQDGDGQFTERSTLVYSPIVDRAFVVLADKLGRPELLPPVRANLQALPYLLHADGEVVTEVSRRQDQFTRGTVAPYWFPSAYLARRDGDAVLAALAAQATAAGGAKLAQLLEYPQLADTLPPAAPLPDHFDRHFAELGIVRRRQGRTSATILLQGQGRLCTLRHGNAVLEGVRLAAAFFGKGQFVPDTGVWRDGAAELQQELSAPYYQPLAERITPAEWEAARARRAQSEVCRLRHSARVQPTADGLQLQLRVDGTAGVPVAVELCFRPGGELRGCRALDEPGCHVLEQGEGEYRCGGDAIRFGPGAAPHRYVQVRGAEPRLPGVSVYLTGLTPFVHTLTLSCG